MGPEECGYSVDPDELDPEVVEFEERVRRAVANGDPTWICPSCGKTACLVNTDCVYCDAEERDYLDDEQLYTDLRQGE